MSDPLKQGFVPTLDGQELRRSAVGTGLVYDDGTPIDDARAGDVVYVNAGELERRRQLTRTGWWREVDESGPVPVSFDGPRADDGGLPDVDVADLLRTLADAHRPAEAAVDVDAGFFHRTLSRWMGLIGDDSAAAARAPTWDYRFWKAELVEEGVLADHAAALSASASPSRVTTWSAVVWRGESAGPERYRYWVAFDDLGFVVGSGWLSAPPDLLGDADGDVDTSAFQTTEVEPGLLERLLSDPDL